MYSQLSASLVTPKTTSVTVNSANDEIDFVGTNFPTAATAPDPNFVAQASYDLIMSANTSSTDGTTTKAKWSLGLPFTIISTAPLLSFIDTTTGHIYWAEVGQAIQVPKTIGAQTAPKCSFAGGCLYEIQANGLAAKMQDGV
jgi:hypothetical protein